MRSRSLAVALTMASLALGGCAGQGGPSTSSSSTPSVDSSSTGTSLEPVQEYVSVKYTNPIYRGTKSDFADPFILREGDTFYAYTTGGEIATSTDLVNWEMAGEVPNPEPWFEGDTRGIWAPSVTKIGDTYNYYYSHSSWGDDNPGIGVMTAPTPLGPFEDHGKVFDSREIGVTNSIDQDVFIDPVSGKIYMYWGSMWGNFAIEMAADGLSVKNPETMADDKVWVAGNKNTTIWDGSSYEGANVIYKDGLYYLFLSQGTCCDGESSTYTTKVGWSESPLGPFVSSTGVDLLGGNRGDTVVTGDGTHTYGTGHCSVLQDDAGDWWIYYHSYVRDDDGVVRGRYMMLDKLSWVGDMPYVGPNFNPSITEMDGPRLLKRS